MFASLCSCVACVLFAWVHTPHFPVWSNLLRQRPLHISISRFASPGSCVVFLLIAWAHTTHFPVCSNLLMQRPLHISIFKGVSLGSTRILQTFSCFATLQGRAFFRQTTSQRLPFHVALDGCLRAWLCSIARMFLCILTAGIENTACDVRTCSCPLRHVAVIKCQDTSCRMP